MNGIRRILPVLVMVSEMREIRRESVAIEDYCVVRINSPDRAVYAVVKLNDAGLRGIISRLVEGIVPRNPCVVSVVLDEFFPEPDCSVLKVFVQPE